MYTMREETLWVRLSRKKVVFYLWIGWSYVQNGSKGNNPNKIPLGGSKGKSSKNNQMVLGRMYAMGDESETPAHSEPHGNVISSVLKVCNQLAYLLLIVELMILLFHIYFFKNLNHP